MSIPASDSIFTPVGTGAVARTVQDRLEAALLASDFGVSSAASASANVTALQNAINAASTQRRALFIDVTGNILLNADIDVPVGVNTAVDIEGQGWTATKLFFTGSGVTKGLNYEGPGGQSYAYCGSLSNLGIYGDSGAPRGVTYYDVNHPNLYRVLIGQFAGCAVKMTDALMGLFSHCLVIGCGSATEFAVEVDGESTTFMWLHSRISGGLAAGGTSKIGGLAIDGTAGYQIIGGAIESTGTPISICSKSASARGCYGGVIDGIDLENPGNNRPYIDVGQGWTGSASLGVVQLSIRSVNGYPSGTTTGLCGARFKHTMGVEIDGTSNLVPETSGATSLFELVGATNLGFSVHRARHLYGYGYPYVMENSAWRKDATPLMPFTQTVTTPGIQDSHPITGASPSLLVQAAQGGYYETLYPDNSSAVTMTSLTDGRRNARVRLVATNGNTTLQHGTGADQFRTLGGADIPMVANRPYTFWHNGTGWAQES